MRPSRIALVAGLVSIASPAWTQESEEAARTRARMLVDQGNTLLERGEAEEAIEKFQEALRAYRSPKIHVNLAEAHRTAGRPAQAVRHYEIFMARGTSKPAVLRKIEARARELEKKVARVELSGDLEGATVTVGSWRAPWRNGWRIPVDPGTHLIVVSKEGRKDFEQRVDVRAGQLEVLEVTLVEAEPIATTPPIDLSPRVASEPPVTASTTGAAEDRPLTEQWWFWAGVGGAVVAVVAIGVVAGTTGGDDTLPTGELPRSSTSDWGRL